MCTRDTSNEKWDSDQNAGGAELWRRDGVWPDVSVSRRAPEAGERTEERMAMGLGGHCIIGETGGVLAIM